MLFSKFYKNNKLKGGQMEYIKGKKKRKHRTMDIGQQAKDIADRAAEKHVKLTKDDSSFNRVWSEVYNQTLRELAVQE
jgi:hypothetical protein